MKRTFSWQLYSGAVGVIVLWTAMIVAMQRAGLGLVDFRPLSYLGIQPMTARIFSLGLLVSSALFVIFAFYIKRIHKVHNHFLMYFITGQCGQIVAAITPYGMKSSYRLIHTIAAFILAFSLPLLVRAFYKSQMQHKHHAAYHFLYYFELVTFLVGMGIFILTKGIAPIGEALPAIGFHVWILALTILTGQPNKVQAAKKL